MKSASDPSFTLVQDSSEDPTLLHFTTTTDHLGNPIAPGTYYLTVGASNWVGASELSPALEVVVPYRVSPLETTMGGNGLIQILGGVAETVTVIAYDEGQVR